MYAQLIDRDRCHSVNVPTDREDGKNLEQWLTGQIVTSSVIL